MLLETTFTTASGKVTLVDGMAVGRNQRGHDLGHGQEVVERGHAGEQLEGELPAGLRLASQARCQVCAQRRAASPVSIWAVSAGA